MRQIHETPQRARAPLAGPILAIAVSLLALSAPSAGAEEPSSGATCAQRYHASLERIAGAQYQGLKAARLGAPVAAADAGLPGNLLFPPVSVGERTREETAALRFAASLARAKGRAGGGSTDADATWMADRLRTALGDYLTQAPSPYLCSGVEDYVAELRGDARRFGPPPVQREALLAAQTAVVDRTVKAALAALKPAPLPADKPADGLAKQPTGAAAEALRPAAGLERAEAPPAPGPAPVAPGADPDLPALKPEQAPKFETSADLLAAIDRLTRTAGESGFLNETALPKPYGAPAMAPPAVSSAAYPVLARLAEARPIVTGVRPLVSDKTVRLRLASALSAIEALDYLMRARTQTPDPVASAIDATFEAILQAHRTDCTCSN